MEKKNNAVKTFSYTLMCEKNWGLRAFITNILSIKIK